MTPRTLFRSLLLAGAALAVPGVARADDDTELQQLLNESVVTAATSTAETESAAPATSTIIDAESLRALGIHTVAEAIDFLSLGAVTTGALDHMNAGSRGVSVTDAGRHFLVLLDGHRVVNGLEGADIDRTAGIPLEIVDRIEVVLGPGSVLYGSNAVLGVVNVVTKSARSFRGLHVGFESELPISIRPWAGGGYETTILGQKAELSFAVEYYRRRGLSLYFTPQDTGIDPYSRKPTRYTADAVGTGIWGGTANDSLFVDTPSALVRLKVGKLELGVNAAYAHAPVWRAPADFDSPDTQNKSRRLSLDLVYRETLSPAVSLKTRLYGDFADTQLDVRVSRAPYCPVLGLTCSDEFINDIRLGGLEVQPSIDWLENGRLVTMVGVDGVVRAGRSKVDTLDAFSRVPLAASVGVYDKVLTGLGAYAQQTWDPTTWLGFNVGLRVDYDPRFAATGSPRFAGRLSPWKGGTLKAIYSSAFRAPSFNESYFAHPLAPVADNLDPARIRSFEGSFEQKLGTHRLLFGLFSTELDGLIEYHRFDTAEATAYVTSGRSLVPPEYQYRNVASIESTGFNGGYEATIGDALRMGATVTGAVARRVDPLTGTTPADIAPRLYGNAHILYKLPESLPTIGLAARATGRTVVESAYTHGFVPPPYAPAQLELRLTALGTMPGVKALSYRVSVDYAAADRNANLVGPVQSPTPQNPQPLLTPLDTFRTTVGLEYAF